MRAHVLVFMVSTSLVLAARSHEVPICLPDGPVTRGAVMKFLTSSSFTDDRARLGLTVADTASLRVLVDSTDAAACQWFRQQVSIPADRPRDAAYYKAVGSYFVSNMPRCTPCTRWGALAVFDTTFALKGAFGM